jgi:dienelactone hydrolase
MLRPTEPTGNWAEFPLQAQRFDLVSRGDFVPGVLYRPEAGDSPAPGSNLPLLVLVHDKGASMDAVELACAAPWVAEGLAVATIDLPLHGRRASPKLSSRLIDGIDRLVAGTTLDPETHALVEEFARQSTSDLIRSLDALCRLPEIDEQRVGFMGFGAGGGIGGYLLAHDPRVSAAVFVSSTGHAGANELDPTQFIAHASNSSLLMLEADEDSTATSAAIRAFYDAAPEPKQHARLPRLRPGNPGEADAKVREFLRKALRL